MSVLFRNGSKYWITDSKSIDYYTRLPTLDEDDDNFNPYNGVLYKEFRLPWWLERYIDALDAKEEEREYELKNKRRERYERRHGKVKRTTSRT